jgi:hypothetical protein
MISIHDGAEERVLDLFPRAIYGVAEQLLGRGTVVWPAGHDPADDMTSGPVLVDDGVVYGKVAYREGASLGGGVLTPDEREAGAVDGYRLGGGPVEEWRTDPAFRLHKHEPIWTTGQGTRGMIIRLPGSPAPKPGDPSAHSDGPCYNRWRLQATAYLDDVPAMSGGFTVWPGSHEPIWREQWGAFHEGQLQSMFRDGGAPSDHIDRDKWIIGGYASPEIERIKRDGAPLALDVEVILIPPCVFHW